MVDVAGLMDGCDLILQKFIQRCSMDRQLKFNVIWICDQMRLKMKYFFPYVFINLFFIARIGVIFLFEKDKIYSGILLNNAVVIVMVNSFISLVTYCSGRK